MPSGDAQLRPIDMTAVDFAALKSDRDFIAAARELVRDQLVRTGEDAAWERWAELLARVRALPGMEGAVIRPDRAEARELGHMEAAGRDLDSRIVGAPRRALEDRAVEELRAEKARRAGVRADARPWRTRDPEPGDRRSEGRAMG